ncbi:MAG: hypothetical protein M0006_00945 [Magnetospirillum sp.]|nr:hypothetical protein [Magnetospirillum sp.]
MVLVSVTVLLEPDATVEMAKSEAARLADAIAALKNSLAYMAEVTVGVPGRAEPVHRQIIRRGSLAKAEGPD